jgi:hypothetical protein
MPSHVNFCPAVPNSSNMFSERFVLHYCLLCFIEPVQSVQITTKFVSSNPAYSEVCSIQHYVIKFVSDLRQVGDFLRVPRLPPPIKQPPRYNWNIVERGVDVKRDTRKNSTTFIFALFSKIWQLSWGRVLVFNTSFNNISIISWRLFYWWRK